MITPSFGISRTFDTTVVRLWTAFTDEGDLGAWYMPPGARVTLNEMNLTSGGSYRFGLTAPDGETMWGKWDIRRIEPKEMLAFVQYFTDQDGLMVRNPHDAAWPRWLKSEFRIARQGTGATVTINLSPWEATEAEIASFRKGLAGLSQGWERSLDALELRLSGPSASP